MVLDPRSKPWARRISIPEINACFFTVYMIYISINNKYYNKCVSWYIKSIKSNIFAAKQHRRTRPECKDPDTNHLFVSCPRCFTRARDGVFIFLMGIRQQYGPTPRRSLTGGLSLVSSRSRTMRFSRWKSTKRWEKGLQKRTRFGRTRAKFLPLLFPLDFALLHFSLRHETVATTPRINSIANIKRIEALHDHKSRK